MAGTHEMKQTLVSPAALPTEPDRGEDNRSVIKPGCKSSRNPVILK